MYIESKVINKKHPSLTKYLLLIVGIIALVWWLFLLIDIALGLILLSIWVTLINMFLRK